jgi:hypothetical protein
MSLPDIGYFDRMFRFFICDAILAKDIADFQGRLASIVEECDGMTPEGRRLIALVLRRGLVRTRGRPNSRDRISEIQMKYFNPLATPDRMAPRDRTRAQMISEVSRRYNLGKDGAAKVFSQAWRQAGKPKLRVREKPGPKPKRDVTN